MTPKRIQRKRTRGWKMPRRTIYVGRPSRFGNPYELRNEHGIWFVIRSGERVGVFESKGMAAQNAIDWYLNYLSNLSIDERQYIFDSLRDFNLACWCPLDQPCHADVLLELANSETTR